MVNPITNVLISQLYTSRKVVLELMANQGFEVAGYAHFSVGEVSTMQQQNQLDMMLEHTHNGTKVYIRYCLAKPIRPANVQEMIDDLFWTTETLTKNDMLYIITKDPANDALTAELRQIWEKDGLFVVVESIKYLQFNILKHVLVPKHSLITQAEVEELMKKYNISTLSEFPDISRFDPVARAIGLRPGQVCHIVRHSKTAISTNYYRVCI